MRRTRLSEFREELLATGGYCTPDDRRAPCRARPGALTTLRFSWNVARVFPMSGLYEACGKLTTQSWAELCFSSVTIAERLGMRVVFEGWKNRQAVQGPVMYLCNHLSTVETIVLPPVVLTYGPFNIVAKSSLGHLPFLEHAAEHMGMITLGRKSPKEDLVKMLTVGTEKIKAGNSFLIFPQGSREPVFSRKRFSSIGAKLAERAGCPIVPIVADTRCQPTRTKGLLRCLFKDFGPVDTSRDIRFACGPAVPCGKSREMHEAAFDWMATKLESWGLPTER